MIEQSPSDVTPASQAAQDLETFMGFIDQYWPVEAHKWLYELPEDRLKALEQLHLKTFMQERVVA